MKPRDTFGIGDSLYCQPSNDGLFVFLYCIV